MFAGAVEVAVPGEVDLGVSLLFQFEVRLKGQGLKLFADIVLKSTALRRTVAVLNAVLPRLAARAAISKVLAFT